MTVFVALALATCTAPAGAAEKTIWGPPTLPNGQSAFPIYESLGVDTLQMSIRWSSVAPTRPADPGNPADPAYRWPPEVATALAEGPRHGIRIALLVNGTPPWANGGRSFTFAPDDPGEFGRFMGAASRRYPEVRHWMIWGEPNMASRFRADSPAQRYSELLDASYGALKAVSSDNVVIGGMTWTGGDVKPAPFVRDMRLPDGRRPRLDWFGHNPFPFRYPDLRKSPIEGGWRDMSDIDTFAQEVDAAFGSGGRAVPLWLSEYTIQSDRSSDVFATFVSREGQARWLTAGFTIADRLGARVKGMGWFSLIDEAGSEGPRWGLLTSELQPKPSLRAFAHAPSVRLRPLVGVPSTISRKNFARRGVRLGIRTTQSGSILVHLRRGPKLVRSRRVVPRGGRASVRLRGPKRRSKYTVVIRAPRAETIVRPLTVR